MYQFTDNFFQIHTNPSDPKLNKPITPDEVKFDEFTNRLTSEGPTLRDTKLEEVVQVFS